MIKKNQCIRLHKGHLGVSNDQNLHIFRAKNTKSCRNLVLPQMPPQIIWASPMTKLCIFLGQNTAPKNHKLFGGPKYPPKSYFSAKNCKHLVLPQMSQKVILGSPVTKTAYLGGQKYHKMQILNKICKLCFCPNCPQKLFGGHQ